MKISLHALGVIGALTMFVPGRAQQIILNAASVIGGTVSLDGTAFNNGSFTATHVVDQQTGSITIEYNSNPPNYWLAASYGSQAAYYYGSYFVLDLGAAFPLGQISLFNTHNGNYGDRMTTDFHIDGSNSVTFLGASNGYDLTSGTTILSGTMSYSLTDPPPEYVFTSSNGLDSGTAYRYLRFTVDDYYHSQSTWGGAGLNEIRIFAAVPEPPTYAALCGAGVLGLALWRQRKLVRA